MLAGDGIGLSTSFPIPFEPGTQYVMCMTDSVGVSGGCQDLYTVYPTTTPPASCRTNNITETYLPPKPLGVKMTSLETGGLLSRFGWPASCSDLQFDISAQDGPVGAPPYTLTVAPAFRTPLNMTFESRARWTVTLDHGHPFFVSVSSSDGLTWVNGPLHAGRGTKECFNPSSQSSSSNRPAWLTLGASLGMSFSFLVIGFLLSSGLFWFIHTRRRIRFDENEKGPDVSGHRGMYSSNTISRESKPSGILRNENVPSLRTRSGDLSTQSGGGASSRARRASAGGTSGLGGAILDTLHLRRPSNNRAGSSDMVLMSDRPGLRRDNTNASTTSPISPNDALDLAGSPIEEVNRNMPFPREDEERARAVGRSIFSSSRNNENVIVPWTGSADGQQPRRSTDGHPGHSVSPPPVRQGSGDASVRPSSRPTAIATTAVEKRRHGSTSTSAGASPTTQNMTRPGTGGSLPPTRPISAGGTPVPVISAPHPHGYHQNHGSFSSTGPPAVTSPPVGINQTSSTPAAPPTHEVYVVHHDGGLAPPVTVFTMPGTRVTELPPGYDNIMPTPQMGSAAEDELTAVDSEHFNEMTGGGAGRGARTKPSASTGPTANNTRPNPATLATALSQAPATQNTSGLGLVNAEDLPLSAISATPGNTIPFGQNANPSQQL
ncbi:hypothetical protein CPB86DRAFT_814247 [Serendipita vermifera]|nr:hypothetical protein CPB86DRAFT_814247 [Serendipita vermifera]